MHYTDGLLELLGVFLGFTCGFTLTSTEIGLGATFGFVSLGLDVEAINETGLF